MTAGQTERRRSQSSRRWLIKEEEVTSQSILTTEGRESGERIVPENSHKTMSVEVAIQTRRKSCQSVEVRDSQSCLCHTMNFPG